MTSSSTLSPSLVATLVTSPFQSSTLGKERALQMLATVMYGAWSGQKVPGSPEDFLKVGKAFIFVEGVKGHAEEGNVSIFFSPRADLETMIAVAESLPKTDGDNEESDNSGFFLAIGCREFCQAVIHYLATGKEGNGANWGFHLIRHLTNAPEGQVIWTVEDDPNGVPQFTYGDIREIFDAAQEAAKAA